MAELTLTRFDDVRDGYRQKGLKQELYDAAGEIAECDLPRDVLTVLIRSQDSLDLPRDVVRREAVEPVSLRNGTEMAVGDTAEFDLWSANRDIEVFGADAERFNPMRSIRDDVPRWGHTFGGGRHACIGMELDGGVPADENTGAPILLGTVALILRGLLARGARRDPDNPPQQDPNIARVWWGQYPVLF